MSRGAWSNTRQSYVMNVFLKEKAFLNKKEVILNKKEVFLTKKEFFLKEKDVYLSKHLRPVKMDGQMDRQMSKCK